MSLYFFDVIDDGMLAPDIFGADLGSFEEAREQAQALLPDIARDEMPDGDDHCFVCQVRDATGRVVYRGKLTYWGERIDPPEEFLIPSTTTRSDGR